MQYLRERMEAGESILPQPGAYDVITDCMGDCKIPIIIPLPEEPS